MNIRPTTSGDVENLQRVLDATALFPSEMLPDMLANASESDSIWLTCEQDGRAVGFCFAVAETLAEGTWNMLAIAIQPEVQGQALGSALVAQLELRLKDRGQRILIADTSGTDAFARTRAFYRLNGYTEEARIRDFWADGDDKVTFRKSLA
jgi:ribosomal protein S18 acetylase RimI-like enzyme